MLITEETAKKTGAKQALKFVSVGLGIAYLIMSLLAGPLFLIEATSLYLNLICAIVIMYILGFFYGQRAGIAILIKEKNYIWIGFLYALLTLVTTIFLASWVGFFQYGINKIGTPDDPFVDYIGRPMFAITIYGLIPVIGVGIWFGTSIFKKGKTVIEASSRTNG